MSETDNTRYYQGPNGIKVRWMRPETIRPKKREKRILKLDILPKLKMARIAVVNTVKDSVWKDGEIDDY